MWAGGVRVIVQNDEGKILMVKQVHPERTVWMVPGGGIEEGETAAEAVVREMKEETGLDVTVGPMIFHVEEVSEKRGQRFVNFFMASVSGGDMQLGIDPERIAMGGHSAGGNFATEKLAAFPSVLMITASRDFLCAEGNDFGTG